MTKSAFQFLTLLALVIAPLASHAAETQESAPAPISMTVSLAPQVPKPGVVGTRGTMVQQLRVMNGSNVSLVKRSGTDYQLEAKGGWGWTQVQQIPADVTALSLTPTLQDGGAISIAIQVSDQPAEQGVSFQSEILIPPDKWVQLYGAASDIGQSTKTYSSRSQPTDQLFIKISF